MKTHSATQSHVPASAPRSSTGASARDGSGKTFHQSLNEAGEASKGKRAADEAGLPDTGGPSKMPRNSSADPTKSDGTYRTRENKKARLDIQTGSGTHESEHIAAWNVVHPGENRKTNRTAERAMPAYHEVAGLHSKHAGTGSSSKPGNAPGSGWDSSKDYRNDQRASLSDPAARQQGTSLSNAYQLNQLGYGHQMAHGNLQYRGEAPSKPYMQANDSYAHTIDKNPGLTHGLTGNQVTDRVDPHGQAEALLARETAHSGQWPTQGRIDEALNQFGAKPTSK